MGVDVAYKSLTQFHIDLTALEEEGERVNQQQELFEVAVLPWRDAGAGTAGGARVAWAPRSDDEAMPAVLLADAAGAIERSGMRAIEEHSAARVWGERLNLGSVVRM